MLQPSSRLLLALPWHCLILLFCCFLSACANSGSYRGKSLLGVGDAAPALEINPRQMKVLVIGGTSGVGLEVVKLSLKRGHLVTAVARRPERMPIQHPMLSVRKADIRDPLAMNSVIPGHQVIVSAVGISPTMKKVTVFSEGIKNVLNAMESNGIERLITVTAVGAGDSEGHGGFLFDKILVPSVLGQDIEDKSEQERIVQQSPVNWTIVRPGFLTDDNPTGGYRVLTELEYIRTGSIARADVAHFIVASFEAGLYSRQTLLLSN